MSSSPPVPEIDPGPASAPARVVGTFFSPVSTFESIAKRPGFLLPLILGVAVSLAIGLMLQPKIDYEKLVRAGLEQRGQTVPEDRLQQIVATQKKVGGIFGTVGAVVFPVVGALLVTLVFWVSFKAFGQDFRFKQAFGVTTHAFLPNTLGAAALAVILQTKDTVDPRNLGDLLRSNPGFLVDPQTQPVIHSMVQSIDIFSFWCMFLLVIGFSAAARTTRRGTAWGIVISIWAVYVLAKAGLAAILPH